MKFIVSIRSISIFRLITHQKLLSKLNCFNEILMFFFFCFFCALRAVSHFGGNLSHLKAAFQGSHNCFKWNIQHLNRLRLIWIFNTFFKATTANKCWRYQQKQEKEREGMKYICKLSIKLKGFCLFFLFCFYHHSRNCIIMYHSPRAQMVGVAQVIHPFTRTDDRLVN